MITYLSSIYNVFPVPPKLHPLFDIELQRQAHEYKLEAEKLLLWCREKTSFYQERTTERSLTELKNLLDELYKLRNIEVPEKQKDKQRLGIMYSQLEVNFLFEILGALNSNFPLCRGTLILLVSN